MTRRTFSIPPLTGGPPVRAVLAEDLSPGDVIAGEEVLAVSRDKGHIGVQWADPNSSQPDRVFIGVHYPMGTLVVIEGHD